MPDYLGCALKGTDPAIVPAITFVLAWLCSLGTGTSWCVLGACAGDCRPRALHPQPALPRRGTMAVMFPISIPLAINLSRDEGIEDGSDEGLNILYTTSAAVLGGSVWGDHCSIVSDTTCLAAAACQCSVFDHFKTQIPCAPLLAPCPAPSDSRSHASHTRAAGTRCSAASARSSLASCPPPMECRRVWASSSRSLSPQPSRLRSPTSLALVRQNRGPAQCPPLRPHPRLPAAGGAVPTYSPTSGEIGSGIWGIKASVMSYCKTPDQKVDAKAEARGVTSEAA